MAPLLRPLLNRSLYNKYGARVMAILGQIARSSTQMRNSHPFPIMVNVVGGEPLQSHLRVVQEALFVECASLHP